MLQAEQLQAASNQAHKYVQFWASIIRISRNAEMQYYCIRRYENALRLSMECNHLIYEYLGYYI